MPWFPVAAVTDHRQPSEHRKRNRTVRRAEVPPGLTGLKSRCRQGQFLLQVPSGESVLLPFQASRITRIPPPPSQQWRLLFLHHITLDANSLPASSSLKDPVVTQAHRRARDTLSSPSHLINNLNSICDFNPSLPRDQTQSRVPRIRSRQLWRLFFC